MWSSWHAAWSGKQGEGLMLSAKIIMSFPWSSTERCSAEMLTLTKGKAKALCCCRKKWRDLPFLCSIINYIAWSFHNKTWWERGALYFKIYCYLYWPMFKASNLCSKQKLDWREAWLEGDTGSHLQAQGSCCCENWRVLWVLPPTSPSCRLPLTCWLAGREEFSWVCPSAFVLRGWKKTWSQCVSLWVCCSWVEGFLWGHRQKQGYRHYM